MDKQLFKSKAFVLKKIPYHDNDWILTLLTDQGSKLTLMAKGARQSKKRFGTQLDLFNGLNIEYKQTKPHAMGRLTQADLFLGSLEIRKDISKFAVASYFSELILEFLQEQEVLSDVYRFYYEFLTELDKPEAFQSHLIPLMEHQFLDLFGFKPVLENCLICQQSLSADSSYVFNGLKGGIICKKCHLDSQPSRVDKFSHPDRASYTLNYSSIQKLLQSYDHNAPKGQKPHWKSQEIKQTRQALEYFIQYTAGKTFKSLQFLSKIV